MKYTTAGAAFAGDRAQAIAGDAAVGRVDEPLDAVCCALVAIAGEYAIDAGVTAGDGAEEVMGASAHTAKGIAATAGEAVTAIAGWCATAATGVTA